MKMKLNRVVVTGYGLTSPIGNNTRGILEQFKEWKDWDW